MRPGADGPGAVAGGARPLLPARISQHHEAISRWDGPRSLAGAPQPDPRRRAAERGSRERARHRLRTRRAPQSDARAWLDRARYRAFTIGGAAGEGCLPSRCARSGGRRSDRRGINLRRGGALACRGASAQTVDHHRWHRATAETRRHPAHRGPQLRVSRGAHWTRQMVPPRRPASSRPLHSRNAGRDARGGRVRAGEGDVPGPRVRPVQLRADDGEPAWPPAEPPLRRAPQVRGTAAPAAAPVPCHRQSPSHWPGRSRRLRQRGRRLPLRCAAAPRSRSTRCGVPLSASSGGNAGRDGAAGIGSPSTPSSIRRPSRRGS